MKKIRFLAAASALVMLCSCGDERLLISAEQSSEEEPSESVTTAAYSIVTEKKDEHKYDTGTEAADLWNDYIYEDEEPAEDATEDVTEDVTEAASADETDPASEEETTEAPGEEKAPDEGEKEQIPEHDNCIKMPFISQDKLPTGCELVSMTMLMKHYGYNMEPTKLIDEGFIKNTEVEKVNGKLVGGDPNYEYIGDPRKSTGYGCYSRALYNGTKKMLDDEFYDVYDLSEMELRDICKQYIDLDQPVLIWASINMEPFNDSEDQVWQIHDSDKEFTWKKSEHCVVLVGYDDDNYYVHDPLRGAYTAYDKAAVEARYEDMGKQAITIIPW